MKQIILIVLVGLMGSCSKLHKHKTTFSIEFQDGSTREVSESINWYSDDEPSYFLENGCLVGEGSIGTVICGIRYFNIISRTNSIIEK